MHERKIPIWLEIDNNKPRQSRDPRYTRNWLIRRGKPCNHILISVANNAQTEDKLTNEPNITSTCMATPITIRGAIIRSWQGVILQPSKLKSSRKLSVIEKYGWNAYDDYYRE